MFAALICLQVQASTLTRQPQTIDVVSYQRVQHALPNGAPDLKAPDNFYVRVISHYRLQVDSDSLTPDREGKRTLKEPETSGDDFESYEETGRAKGQLASAFREVFPPGSRADFAPHAIGHFTRGPLEQVVCKGLVYLMFDRTTTIEKVETHSQRRRHITRTRRTSTSGTGSTMLPEGQIYDPSSERVFWCEDKPEIRVDPPVYGYDIKR